MNNKNKKRLYLIKVNKPKINNTDFIKYLNAKQNQINRNKLFRLDMVVKVSS
jgi:hypothetical protein